ncbi:MAG: FAD-dependent monooxygenase [Pseudomonadota bacterium]|nr:FAD-dependent monooxygenase [Pseudomonadota bacterium]
MSNPVGIFIIGAGFSGLISAILARKNNVSCVVIDKRDRDTISQSNAHYLNAYTLEILVSLGLSIDELRKYSVDLDVSKRMVCCRTLNKTVGRIDLSEDPGYDVRFNRIGRFGAFLNIHCQDLYRLLLDLAIDVGVDICWLHTVVDLNAHTGLVKVECLQSGDQYEQHCDFILACDGASGPSVDLSHMPVQNVCQYLDFITIEALGSIESFVQDRALFYWVFHESMTACMVSFDLRKKQLLQIPILPGADADLYLNQDHIRQCFSALCDVSPDQCEHEFSIKGRWNLKTSALSSASKGKLFFLGDCLHQVLPAGGMGLNLAIADSYNLIWKLVHDLSFSRPRFSTSYQCERLSLSHEKLKQSVLNYKGFLDMAKSFICVPDQLFKMGFNQFSSSFYSTWLQGVQILNDTGHINQRELDQVIEQNKGHFDGIAMHNDFVYDSFLIHQPSQRRFYDLAVLSFRVFSGMRIQNFSCIYKGKCQQIYDLLAYDAWTIVLHSDHMEVSSLLDLITVKKQICVVDSFLHDNAFLPMNKDVFLLIRPDQIVAVVVDLSRNGEYDKLKTFLIEAFCPVLL